MENEVKKKSWLNPRWVTIQGADPSPVDVYGAIEAPDAATLLKLNEDTVYACTDWCAKAVAKTELKVLVTTHPGQKSPRCYSRPAVSKSAKARGADVREVLDHPLVDLLNHPNPEMSKYDFLYYLDTQMSLVGEGYVTILREDYDRKSNQEYTNEGLPTGLWPMLTQFVSQIADKGKVIGYEYGISTPPIFWKKEDVIHFRFINHENPYISGYGPVRAVYERILLSKNELAYLNSLFRNQARPDSLVLLKGGAGADQCERVQKEMNMRFAQGGIGGIYAVDAEDMDMKPLGWAPKDVLGTELYKWTKLQIINAFSLNPALFDQESSNRAVATQARIQAKEQAVEPRCRLIEERINHQLVPEYDSRLLVEFESPIQEDEDFDLEKRKTYLAAGVYMVNEVRKMEGLAPIPGGDAPVKLQQPQINNEEGRYPNEQQTR